MTKYFQKNLNTLFRLFNSSTFSTMNLVLDFGNTRIKAAVFNEQQLLAKHIFTNPSEIRTWIQKFNGIQKCLIASVTKQHESVLTELHQIFPTFLFKSDTPIPISNLYKSTLSLGSDRIAASVGAFSVCANAAVLTIDAGTCIKYNFVNELNQYLGGAISPGIHMRLKAMNHFTSALPLIDYDKNYHTLIGASTAESLLSGALIAAACEVDGMIERYLESYPNLIVFMTGGDADYLCKQVKNRFFANPDLIMIGLNTILNFNDKK